MTRDPPAPRADRASARAFRELLRRGGYTRGGIQNLLGGSGDVLARAGQRPVYLRRVARRGAGRSEDTPDPEALLAIVRLFLLDAAVDADGAEACSRRTAVRALEELRIVEQSAGMLRGGCASSRTGRSSSRPTCPTARAKHRITSRASIAPRHAR